MPTKKRQGELVTIKKEIGFCNVYAASVESERKMLWNDITKTVNSFQVPWVVGGDFNVVLEASERVGLSCNEGSMRNFNSFLLIANVIDLPLQGMSFTWTNSREQAVWSRLDRYLISPSLLISFPNICQRGLSRSLSDYNPILLREMSQDWGPIPFCFFNSWLDDNSIMKDAMDGWKGCELGAWDGLRAEELRWRQKLRVRWLG
ncbi:hypothetical protein Ddye_013987 [Dipteronia dyeriana]|uniref:Endonuclease/exonuclease/phosphatase domain-containing protein n=1 Tax=Dipteronia dyeriana TaxID=168575 RepID=A0AAE0CK67_9ROSI|nr:hypothetical protein Ddye_013987 [Dipteronia dyeriana]